jgi:signal transduction histidine kinase
LGELTIISSIEEQRSPLLFLEYVELEKSYEFQEAYTFELALESTPDFIWTEIFNNEWSTSFYMMKRQVMVIGSTIRVVTAPNEIKDKIEWIKSIVNSTNERIEQYNKQVEQENEAERQRLAREKATIDKMRELLKK